MKSIFSRFLVFNVVLLFAFFFSFHTTYGMEAAVFDAAEGGLGKDLAESVGRDTIESEANSIAEKMGIPTKPGEFAKLPPAVKEEFEAQVKDMFEGMKGEFTAQGKGFFKEGGFTEGLSSAKDNFIDQLKAMNSEKGSGFTKKEWGGLGEKLQGELGERVEAQVPEQVRGFKINEATGSNFKAGAKTEAETELSTAEQKEISAQRDLSYSRQIGDEPGIEKAKTELGEAKDAVIKQQKAVLEEANTKVKDAEIAANKAKINEANAKVAGDRGNIGSARADAQDAEAQLGEAQAKQAKEVRKSALSDYRDAKKVKEGEPGISDAKKKTELQEANDRVRKASKTAKEAKGEEKTKAEEELTKTKAQQADAREQAGTKISKEVLQEEAKADIEGADTALKEATEADRVAGEQLEEAGTRLYESGQVDWFSKEGAALRKHEWWKSLKQLAKDQLISGIIGGFAFSFPNMIIEVAEAAYNARTKRKTMRLPQYFGKIWMQIPNDLISGGGEPVVAEPLYVAIPDAKTTDKKVKRSNTADTDKYLKHAPMYMARTEYDDYATVPITSAQFPGEMVHLNTGFQFVGDGKGDPDWPIIQLFGKDVPQHFRGTSLQEHLDKKAGDIRRGIATDQYFELRGAKTKYKGSPTIADQFEASKEKNPEYKLEYPDEDRGYGSILNDAVQAFANGAEFGPFRVQAFEPLSNAAQQELGITKSPGKKPWVGYGQYLYQTADTPVIKSVRSILARDPKTVDIANEIFEYVVMQTRAGEPVPLQLPNAAGNPHGVASYQLNPVAESMISLFNVRAYNDQGKAQASGFSADDLIKGLAIPHVGKQIGRVNAYINEKLKYGPFIIGDKKLETKTEWADNDVYVYIIAGALEDGSDDYLVAAEIIKKEGLSVTQLPGSPPFFISLVTSRVYDSQLLPHDNQDGRRRRDASYTIYKQKNEDVWPLVVVGKPTSGYGIPIATGLSAPLYSLFMDWDINPNTVLQKSIAKKEDRAWYARFVGNPKGDKPYPLAEPLQWALGDRGPALKRGGKEQRFGQFLLDEHKDVLKLVHASYKSWKEYYKGLDPDAIRRELGTFSFGPKGAYPIVIRASSPVDLKNGNFVYTSPRWPDEYLVLSDGKDSSGQRFATEYDVGSPQPYAISLSTGRVYASGRGLEEEEQGQVVSHIENLDQLVKRVSNKQGKFLPPLRDAIASSRTAQQARKQDKLYGIDTFFGPFKLYISEKDFDAKHYLYANMAPFGNPFKLSDKALKDALEKANYYVAIELKDKDGPLKDSKNWTNYGAQLSKNTALILNIVTGILYDYHGGFSGYFPEFSDAIDRDDLDIEGGYLKTIFDLLNATWPGGIRGDLKTRIANATKAEYQKLLEEKKQVKKSLDKEGQLYAPLDGMLKKALDDDTVSPYVKTLQKIEPIRYVKAYEGKYYTVVPQDPGPKTYIDYNVGPPGKDHGVGISYDKDGQALVCMTGWALETARAYAGINVKPDSGTQELMVAVDHPAIPLDGMVKLEAAAIEKKLVAAREGYQKALKAAGNKATDELLEASRQLGFARQEYEAAQVAQKIIAGLKASGLYADYTFYYHEGINTYFIGIPDIGGDRFIDLKGGYEFNPDGSARLATSPVYINEAAKESDDILFVGQIAPDSGVEQDFIAVFKGQTDKQYHTWFVFEEKKEYKDKTVDHNYSVVNEAAESANVVYMPAGKKTHRVIFEPDEDEIVSYVKDPNQKFCLLRYFGTQGADGTSSYERDDAESLEPTFIVWDGKPDLALKRLYYKNNLIALSGKGDTFTGRYTEDDQTRDITLTEVKKTVGKSVQVDYVSITDGKDTFEMLYDTSILIPQLPLDCTIKKLKEQSELDKEAKARYLNWWKQCPGGWDCNVVADSSGINRLMMGIRSTNLKSVPANKELEKEIAELEKQAGGRAPVLKQNIQKIRYDAATNQYLYELIKSRDGTQAYYRPEWEGWYVDLSNGVLYAINPATNKGYWPIGAMQASQLYLLLDRLEVAVSYVADDTGKPLFDAQGAPVIDSLTKKQVAGRLGLVYRSPTVIKDEVVFNQELVDAAKEANRQQGVGK